MSALFANKTTIVFLLSKLGRILLSEVSVRLLWFFGRGSVEMFLKVLFIAGWASLLFLIFALDFEVGFFAGRGKWFFVFNKIFEEIFLLTDLVKA